MTLKPGEKYLTIQIVGHSAIAAYKNKDKKEGSNEPDYKGNGVAVWINKKKESEVKKTTEPDL